MSRAGKGWLIAGLAALLLVAGGCSDRSEAGRSASAASSVERPASRGKAGAKRSARRPGPRGHPRVVPPARVTRGEGEAAEHRTVKPGEPLDGAPEQSVRVELAQAGEVQLRPGAHARLGSVAPAQVVLSGGRASLDRPGGLIGQPPLRVATPAVTVVIPAMGQAEVAALADGRAWVGVVSGQLELETGEAGKDGRVTRRSLSAGQQVLVGTGEEEPEPLVPGAARASRPASDLASKAEARAEALSRSAKPLPVEDAARMSEHALEALDALLRDVKAEHDAGRVLARSIKQVGSVEPERARGLRREIVAHSATLLHLHWRLLPLWERAAALDGFRALRGGAEKGGGLGNRTSRVQAELLRQP